MVRKVNLREEKMVGNRSLRSHFDEAGSLGKKKLASVITKIMSKLNSGSTKDFYDFSFDYIDDKTGTETKPCEIGYWGEWDSPTTHLFVVDVGIYVYKNNDLNYGTFMTIPCEIIYDTEDNTYYVDPDGDLSDINKFCREIKAGTKKRKKSVKESSSPSDMGMKSLRRDFTGLSRDERKKKGYLYFTKHGLGPGTLPRDVDLDNYLTAIYLDRPLSSEELDYYDIYPETQNSRFMHLMKESRGRSRRRIKESRRFSDAKKYKLLKAAEAAGAYFDTISSSIDDEEDLRFNTEYWGTQYFDSWQDLEDWLEGVVFDDPDISDAVEKILHPERF